VKAAWPDPADHGARLRPSWPWPVANRRARFIPPGAGSRMAGAGT